jgi:hypothetical protein
MRAGFKAQVKRDLKTVFHNDKEHADKIKVEYNGKRYNIPIVINSDANADRVKIMRDNADGVFVSDLTVYISFYDLKIVPRKETKIVIDGIEYMINRAAFEAGSIILDLEVLDE